ncbi:ribonucleoside triphosphate reductase [Eubacterium multiforme]|uniref:Ribonucleoside-triphosphate reductase n=1 Tax=Eubacterium multiforme TaxID=83339 RepID=A0ABT9UWF3_9FIRM|nr:ribonucleoside triphosphate reductase [Eubacterium multiforme]MDQ0150611.1 ribonucleoside-triphosphate reductase [Eubacterium multiforme]
MIESKKIINDYLDKSDWRVNENSNSPYSFGSLNKHIIAEVSKDYWLNEVYKDKRIINAYVSGDLHIHDLGGLTLYCCGYSLRNIIMMGVQGIPNIPTSGPARHFDAVLNQIANLVTIYQNEIMGAVAFNSFDTLLAPYIKKDKLSYKEIKQNIQNFIFSINSNSRAGAEPAFTNITFDLIPPNDLKDDFVLIGDDIGDFKYKDCQEEMDLLNKAFYELMNEGDFRGRPFAYPIPTYNINKDFDWDNPHNKMLFEMTGKFGYPYFANFVNSDMDQSDVRSMCCRLNLDLRELRKRNGGLFGSGDSTGSIGVVTINLPRLAYQNKNNEEAFFSRLHEVLTIAKDSLEIKREWLNENMINKNMLPAFDTYVGTLNNHFSTIGIVGLNEMCENFNGKNILTEEGKDFSIKVCNFIRECLIEFQEETGNLYNFEATPAESTCYRLAKKDVAVYDDIITRGPKEAPYYTNSCHIPPNEVKGLKQLFDHQDDLQILFTGGTVVHIYCDGAISGDAAKHIVKTICEKYRTPYISLSPLNRYCEDHGYIKEKVDNCPICGKKLDLYQRITGYLRKVEFFNDGKKSEFKDRNQLKL